MSSKKPYRKISTNVRSTSLIIGLIKLGMGVVEMVAPSFAANLGAKLFTTTRRYRRNSQERALLKEAKAFKIDWKRKQLAAWSWGNGDTVLLVHGWEGRGSQLGSFVRPLVNAGYRVVAFDGPGHGDSGGNSSSVVALAESICAVSEQVGKIDTLIAHSVGSAASTLALSKGLKVEKAIYIAPPVGMLKYVQKFAQTVGLSLETADKIFNILCQKFNVDSSSLYLPAMARKMNTPLLVIQDRFDKDVEYEDGLATVQAWPGAKLLTTVGLGHRKILHNSDVVMNALSFIQNPGSFDPGDELIFLDEDERKCTGCQSRVVESWRGSEKYCSRCVFERELYDQVLRWDYAEQALK